MFTRMQTLKIPELAQNHDLESDSFTVISVIKGGMGLCIKVRSESSNKYYAVKALKDPSLSGSAQWERFLREMKIWLTLSSFEGVVEAYCITRINELPCVCAQWMDNGDFREVMRYGKPELIYNNLLRIVQTLDWVYTNHKIIHRDLKPENILLDNTNLAHISDWGISRIVQDYMDSDINSHRKLNDKAQANLTQTGQFMGTIIYASPEQIRARELIDHRTDIYSIGCILYELETGTPPFEGITIREIADGHLNKNPSQLGGLFKKTNFGLGNVIDKCLRKNPKDRYQDYRSLYDDIKKVGKDMGIRLDSSGLGQRYYMPFIGAGEFQEKMNNNALGEVLNEDGTYGLIDLDNLIPYLKEAEHLASIGEYDKAVIIYSSLFIPEIAREIPDLEFISVIAVNYANCLIKTNKASEAINVLECVSGAETKSAEFYLNLSLAYLHRKLYEKAEATAKSGLLIYKDDKDLIGNLLIAQSVLEKYDEALVTAELRLTHGRDVHSLEEVANLYIRLGRQIEDSDWPLAVNYFSLAIGLFREAIHLNPRWFTAHYGVAHAFFCLENYYQSLDKLIELVGHPLYISLRLRCICLTARCLDRSAQFKACYDLCEKWLCEYPDHIELKRIKAETTVDGFCIGKELNGKRVVDKYSLEFFENVINTSDRISSDYCYLARLYEWMGYEQDAIEILNEADSLYPNIWEIGFTEAMIKYRIKDYSKALTIANVLKDIASWKPKTWELLSWIHESMGNEIEEKQASERAELIRQRRDELIDAVI